MTNWNICAPQKQATPLFKLLAVTINHQCRSIASKIEQLFSAAAAVVILHNLVETTRTDAIQIHWWCVVCWGADLEDGGEIASKTLKSFINEWSHRPATNLFCCVRFFDLGVDIRGAQQAQILKRTSCTAKLKPFVPTVPYCKIYGTGTPQTYDTELSFSILLLSSGLFRRKAVPVIGINGERVGQTPDYQQQLSWQIFMG